MPINPLVIINNYQLFLAYHPLSGVQEAVSGEDHALVRKGNPMVRNYLFMCSFTACNHNAQCKSLYERIVNKGKSKKLALIAVSNKLLKQSLAIAKSGVCYDPNFRSVLVS